MEHLPFEKAAWKADYSYYSASNRCRYNLLLSIPGGHAKHCAAGMYSVVPDKVVQEKKVWKQNYGAWELFLDGEGHWTFENPDGGAIRSTKRGLAEPSAAQSYQAPSPSQGRSEGETKSTRSIRGHF